MPHSADWRRISSRYARRRIALENFPYRFSTRTVRILSGRSGSPSVQNSVVASIAQPSADCAARLDVLAELPGMAGSGLRDSLRCRPLSRTCLLWRICARAVAEGGGIIRGCLLLAISRTHSYSSTDHYHRSGLRTCEGLSDSGLVRRRIARCSVGATSVLRRPRPSPTWAVATGESLGAPEVWRCNVGPIAGSSRRSPNMAERSCEIERTTWDPALEDRSRVYPSGGGIDFRIIRGRSGMHYKHHLSETRYKPSCST